MTTEYPRTVPYIMMRSLPAITGTLLVPCVYEVRAELCFLYMYMFVHVHMHVYVHVHVHVACPMASIG